MHSRVIQLEVKMEDLVTNEEMEYTFEDPEFGFVSHYADYVSACEKENTEEDIKWVLDSIKNISSVTEENDHKVINFRENLISYFESSYYEFKTKALQLSLEEFAKDELPFYKIKTLVEPYGEFYVYTGGSFMSMESFIRMLNTWDKNRKFYIGGILNYHY